MEKNIVLNGNRLIAEFMGYEYIPFNNPEGKEPGWWLKGISKVTQAISRQATFTELFLCRRDVLLRYDSSWEWLIPVISQIQELPDGLFARQTQLLIGIENSFQIKIDIAVTWQRVIKFIEVYNKNKSE